MMKYKACYQIFISQFEIHNDPPLKEGYHRHHIIPQSQQTETDNRQVYLTPAQHLWAHILYDRENGTNTAQALVHFNNMRLRDLNSYEDCLVLEGLRAPQYGKKLTDEHRRHLSENHADMRGEKNPMYGRRFNHTEEAKKKISENHARYWLGKERHLPSFTNRGRKWFNNGVSNVMAFECPEGFMPGRIYRRKSE